MGLTLLGGLLLSACMVEDERTPIGPGSAAAAYCVRLGFTLTAGAADGGQDSVCTFTDGSSCSDSAFYTAQCGQAHSYCVAHGGTIATTTFDAGTWVGTAATCTTSTGASCDEDSYSQSGHCP